MSIVGPRTERPEFIQKFREQFPQYNLRHKMKAGMAGWAKVNGFRGNTSWVKRPAHDMYYIEHWSLWLDKNHAPDVLERVYSPRGVLKR